MKKKTKKAAKANNSNPAATMSLINNTIYTENVRKLSMDEITSLLRH
jgi:hypothetical protein